jgi:thiol-disulfide isomerase/thioredoxin
MNWPKYVVEYGQAVAVAVIILSAVSMIGIVVRKPNWLRRRALGWVLFLFAGVLIYQAATLLRWSAHKIDPLKQAFRAEHQKVPDLPFTLLEDGSRRNLSDYRGKVIVLNIWATWCPPCREEMPGLDRLQQKYGKEGLVVIAVTDEDKQQVANFPAFDKMNVVKGHVDPESASPVLYVRGDVARPITHVIDREGILRETLIGGHSYTSLEKTVLPYLATGS